MEPKDEAGGRPPLALETLSGDLRDALLTHVRAMETPWSKLSERDQGDKIEAVERMARHLVTRTVFLVAERGCDTIPAVLGKFTVDGGKIKGAFEAMVTEDNVVALSDHQKMSVLIVLADAGGYMGERAPAEPDPDEPELPVGDGETVDPETGEVGEAVEKPKRARRKKPAAEPAGENPAAGAEALPADPGFPETPAAPVPGDAMQAPGKREPDLTLPEFLRRDPAPAAAGA